MYRNKRNPKTSRVLVFFNSIHRSIIPLSLSAFFAIKHLLLREKFEYTQKESFFVNFINIIGAGYALRCKFYFVSILATANFEAIGFPNIVNIRPLEIELGGNVKDLTRAWNIYTNLWLKDSVFNFFKSRSIESAALATFFVSSFYHGPNFCYLCMFITLSLIVPTVKKNNAFINSKFPPKVGRIVNIIIFMPLIAYLMLPFNCLSIKKTLYIWKGVYFSGHIFLIVSFLYHLLSGNHGKTKSA